MNEWGRGALTCVSSWAMSLSILEHITFGTVIPIPGVDSLRLGATARVPLMYSRIICISQWEEMAKWIVNMVLALRTWWMAHNFPAIPAPQPSPLKRSAAEITENIIVPIAVWEYLESIFIFHHFQRDIFCCCPHCSVHSAHCRCESFNHKIATTHEYRYRDCQHWFAFGE